MIDDFETDPFADNQPDEDVATTPAEAQALEEAAKQNEAKEEPKVDLPDQVLSTADSKKMMEECCAVRVSVYGTWPSGSKALDNATKQRVATAENVDASQLRIGVGQYDSGHEIVSKANKLKQSNQRIRPQHDDAFRQIRRV